MATPYKFACLLGLLAATFGIDNQTTYAQTFVLWDVADGNYNTESNWDSGFRPLYEIDEVATINNDGIARISNNVSEDPARIILGQATGESGTLILENGGSIEVLTFLDNVSIPGVDVGLEGVGTLEALPGSTLSAKYLRLGGEGGSSATVGGTGAGTTTLNIGIDGTRVSDNTSFRVIGPNVDYSTLTFEVQSQATFISEITGTTHSAIKTTNAVNLDGTLKVEFNGYSPTVGDSWNLFDTSSVSGEFAEIDTSAAPALPFAQEYVFREVADGSSQNGVYGQLGVEQRLVLSVNRDSGLVSIVTGPEAVAIDGYRISSQIGGLNSSNWNSLEDQNVSDWKESPPNGLSDNLAELKPLGSTSVTSGSGMQLGNVFQYPVATEFGTELEDIAFEYYAENGDIVQGKVIYEGDQIFNNLVLIIDPDDGSAQLLNQSDIAVSIDGYKISSASGSLQPNNGDWSSLEDQGAESGAWHEANPSSTDLIELRPEGASLLSGGVWNLGNLFDSIGGVEDLTLEYLFPEDEAFTRTGEVVYRDITISTLVGDYNNDGSVDAADYTVWRDTLNDSVTPGQGADGNGDGMITSADYTLWVDHYGESSSNATALAVPEPASLALLLVGFGSLLGRRQKTSI